MAKEELSEARPVAPIYYTADLPRPSLGCLDLGPTAAGPAPRAGGAGFRRRRRHYHRLCARALFFFLRAFAVQLSLIKVAGAYLAAAATGAASPTPGGLSAIEAALVSMLIR